MKDMKNHDPYDPLLQKIQQQQEEISWLKSQLKKEEELRAETLLAWSSLCELLGTQYLEVNTDDLIEDASSGVCAEISVKAMIDRRALLQTSTRTSLLDHIGEVISKAVLSKLYQGEAGEYGIRQLLRSIPVPLFTSKLKPPKW